MDQKIIKIVGKAGAKAEVKTLALSIFRSREMMANKRCKPLAESADEFRRLD
ncbi:MAG TPA: hypothetical protein VGL10_01685 [Gammaproteobacteria bacterium]